MGVIPTLWLEPTIHNICDLLPIVGHALWLTNIPVAALRDDARDVLVQPLHLDSFTITNFVSKIIDSAFVAQSLELRA